MRRAKNTANASLHRNNGSDIKYINFVQIDNLEHLNGSIPCLNHQNSELTKRRAKNTVNASLDQNNGSIPFDEFEFTDSNLIKGAKDQRYR